MGILSSLCFLSSSSIICCSQTF